MKFYPTADIDFYVDIPGGWEKHCHYGPNKKFQPHSTTTGKAEPGLINYWRDIEGAKKPQITLRDCYFKKWPTTRRRPGACLPLLYAMGERFIRLEKAYPAGFKCTPLPVSLAEFKAIRKKLRAQAKALRAIKKIEKKKANQCKGKKAQKTALCKKLAKQQKKDALPKPPPKKTA